jgi:predicted NBD/HSP70 family sugar kinase
MKRTWLAAGVLALFAAAAPAAPLEQLAWLPGLEAAQEEARGRKAPLLVVLNMDGEHGNEAMLSEVYALPAVRDAAKKCAVTIASLGKHAEVDDPKLGRKVCSKFGRVTCAEHMATEKVVREQWLKRGPKDDVDSPRHIFRAPDGRPLFERVWTIRGEALVLLIDRAVAACAPETLAAWDTTEARLARVFDPFDCVRACALRDLLAARDAAVDAKLFELVRKSENAEAAGDAVRAIAGDMTPARAEGMRKLLSAPSAVVRMNAAAAIAGLREKDGFAVLSAALAKEKAVEAKCVMLRALAVCGGDPAKARSALLHAAKSGEPPTRAHAVVALAQWAKEDEVVDALRKMPGNDKLPENLRAAAAWTLGLSGRKEIADELRAAAAERGAETLKHVAQAAAARLSSGAEDPQYANLRYWVAPIHVALAEPLAK